MVCTTPVLTGLGHHRSEVHVQKVETDCQLLVSEDASAAATIWLTRKPSLKVGQIELPFLIAAKKSLASIIIWS